MDFAKTFKKNSTQETIHKLEYYGIRGSAHKWINSCFSGRTQQVVLDGQASDPVPVLSGVPQGSVIGPVLFLIFKNDLPDIIRSSVRLFIDDCANANTEDRYSRAVIHMHLFTAITTYGNNYLHKNDARKFAVICSFPGIIYLSPEPKIMIIEPRAQRMSPDYGGSQYILHLVWDYYGHCKIE